MGRYTPPGSGVEDHEIRGCKAVRPPEGVQSRRYCSRAGLRGRGKKVLRQRIRQHLDRFKVDPDAASSWSTLASIRANASLDVAELAAWTRSRTCC